MAPRVNRIILLTPPAARPELLLNTVQSPWAFNTAASERFTGVNHKRTRKLAHPWNMLHHPA